MSSDRPTPSPTDPQARRRAQIQLGTDSWQIGRFQARPGSELFASETPPGHDAIVFPRRAVQIRRDGGCTVLADPSKILLHHAASTYRRTAVDPEGDECVWYWLAPDFRKEIRHGLGSQPDFTEAAAHCPRSLFRAERALSAYVVQRPWESEQGEPDWLMLEEAVLEVARGALSVAGQVEQQSTSALDQSAARFNVDRADAYLAAHFHRAPSLDDIAAAARCSKFHLARLYRAHRGRTLHAARTELQLRAAYDLVVSSRRPMTEIALDVGFSSASHFSTRFLRAFGTSPTHLRRRSRTSPRVGAGPLPTATPPSQ